MKTQELLELAALDALGLLEEHERDEFDRAFRAAPPALQAQIRREQTRIAKDDTLLPEVDAPLGLKAKVLATWREAMTSRKWTLPPILPSSGVSPVWRMAAVGSLAAVIVMGVSFLYIKGEFERYSTMAHEIAKKEAEVKDFGPRLESDLFNVNVTKVHFVAVDNKSCKGEATLMFDTRPKIEGNRKTYAGQLHCRRFSPSPVDYKVVLLDKDGKLVPGASNEPMSVVGQFRVNAEEGSALNLRITITVEENHGVGGLAIVGPGEGTPILGKIML